MNLSYSYRNGTRILLITAVVLLLLSYIGQAQVSAQAPISFDKSTLQGFTAPGNLTTLQFGPDNRLYVAERYGTISALTIIRNGPGDYEVTAQETIDIIPFLGNHTDTGTLDTSSGFVSNNRQVTGLVVTGTVSNPIIYVSSSDPREGGGGAGTDTNLDTNSGIVSRLTWNGATWEHLALVRGLPRSEENHAVNGMALDEATNTLYLAVGGFTNMGAPSFNFTYIAEYAYSAAILSIDLDAIGNTTYDLPTLDDPTRANVNGITDPSNPAYDGIDINDPWGGNDGLNQARIEVGSPVQIYSSGYRNPYDIVITESGDMYSIDNGPNYNWGGPPLNENPGQCVDAVNENDSETHYDNLHLITGQGFYAGHPAPVRANPQGLYPNEADSPVPYSLANPVECDYREPGVDDGALATWVTSTNGITEYTATNFFGQMQGDLLTVSYDGDVYRMKPDGAGGLIDLTPANTGDWGYESLFPNVGTVPLDITTQNDADPFPGTIWVAVFVDKTIQVFEPVDFPCNGDYDAFIDEDGDGFDNADEIDNGTNPCSNGSIPPDVDGDLESDLNDPDDDNDGIPDVSDVFQIDPQNGVQTTLPVNYQFFNDDPGTGFFGVGFTGMMVNGTTDYLDMFEEAELTIGGTAGKATIDNFTDGTAFGAANTQDYAYQWGVNVTQADGNFAINAQMNANFFNNAPEAGDEQGIYFGNGDQDNYFQLALAADETTGAMGFEVIVEVGGVPTRTFYPVPNAHLNPKINLYMSIDPVAGTVQPKYDLNETGYVDLGTPITLTGELLDVVQTTQVMAVGLIANFETGSSAFGGTWDYVFVQPEQPGVLGANPAPISFGDVVQGTFVDRAITLQNLGQLGDQDINVASLSLTGSADFTLITDPTPILLAPGASANVIVRYQPLELELDTATLNIVHDGINIPLNVALNGTGILDYDPIYRVNIGGPVLTDPEAILNWSADNGANPSPYANHTASGSTVTSTGASIDYSNPILPDYTPAMLFNTGRWDGSGPIEMTYDFPVDDGTYEVRLYFAEVYAGAAVAGARVWDAEVEGTVPSVFDDIDRFALAGFEAGYMLAAETNVTDGSLTIRFLHQVENPELQGIEIIPVFVPPSSDLGVSSPTMDFGGVSQGIASQQVLTLTNLGDPSDPAITINGIDYSGADAGDFTDDYSGATVLQPGDSIDVTVTLTASSGGTKSATLTIIHDGGNDPTIVNLTALAYENGALALSPSSLDFGQVQTGASATLALTLSNLGSPTDDDIEVTNLVVTGSNTYQFQFEDYPEPLIVPAGQSIELDVTFTPQDIGIFNVTLTAAHDGVNSPVAISASAQGTEPYIGPVYRVNVAGQEVIDPQGIMNWAADNGGNPSPYWVAGGNGFGGTGSTLDLSSPSIPAGTPSILFTSERYDPSGGSELTYEFPVTTGTYEVRIYLAELWSGITGAGQRIFDVELEGAVPASLNDIDTYALAGFEAGYMVSGQVQVSDGGLSLRFLHVNQNPTVKAIEIIAISTTPSAILGTNAPSYDFGGVQVGGNASLPITISNDGTGGAPTLTISGISFDNADFTSDFAAPIVLNEGENAVVNVTFAPTAGGILNANMNITHDGSNAPSAIPLTGFGSQAGVLAQVETSLNFGNVLVDATGNGTVTVTNLGTASDPAITISALNFSGADAALFGHSESLPLSVAGGASQVIDLNFTPTSTGVKTAQLTIVSDGTQGDLTVDLTANATETSPTASAILRIETGGDIQSSSTYNPSFYIENTSTDGQTITSVSFDISSAIVPDVVFDPLGVAGDSGGRCLFPDGADVAPTGFITPTDPCADPFFDAYEGGYNGITVNFADFNSGEHFLFGVDIDPTSTKGTNPPGPDHAASVSGYELFGSVVTVTFSDGSILTSELWRYNSSVTGSYNEVTATPLAIPSIEVLGLVATPPTTVSDLNQIIRVTGPVGASVDLLISEGEMVEQAGGGYDVDPFEINTVLNIAQYTATIGAGGSVDIPVTLLDDELIDGTYGGLNYIAAVIRDGNQTSHLSNRIVLEYEAPTVDIIFGADVSFDVQEGQALVIGDSVSTSTSDAGTPTINLTAIDNGTSTTPPWLSIPANVVAGNPIAIDVDVIGLAPGTHTATVTGSAAGYSSDSFIVTVNVNDILITISNPLPFQNIPGDSVTVTWTSTGGLLDDHVHVTLDDLSTPSVDPHIGSLPQNDSYTFTSVPAGNYNIIVEMANVNHIVYDGTQEVISISVGLADQPPVVTNPGDQSNEVGDTVSLQVQATDPELQPLTYGASDLPPGLSINTNTGLITGTIAAGAVVGSPYPTVISVSDGNTQMNASLSWTITAPPAGPAVTQLLLIDVQTGTPVTALSNGYVVNLDNFTNGISIQANTTGTISQVQFSANGGVVRTEGVAPYTIAGDNAGNYNEWDIVAGSYSITATPLNNPSGALTVNITVEQAGVNLPPSVTNPGAKFNAEGDSVSLQIVANDPESQPLSYAASGLPTGLSINPTTGLISGTVAAGTSAASPYSVSVTVSDGTTPVNVVFGWTITDPSVNNPPVVTNPGAQSSIEGNGVSLQIAATDPESQAMSYSASGLPANLSINPTTGLISGTVAAGASASSPYSVTVTVSDGTNPVNVNFTWAVNPVPVGPAVTELVLIDVQTGTPVTALSNGYVVNLDNFANGISIQANTSGTISQVQFTANGGVVRTEGVAPYTIAGDNAGNYNEWDITAGSYSITATPLNNPSGALTVNITVEQAGANLPPVVTNPGAQLGAEGDSVSLQIVANDPESQPLSYAASGLPTGLSINPTTGLISGTLPTGAAAASPYSVTLTVSDGTTPVNINISWTVIDPSVDNPPNVTNPGAKSNIEGASVSLQIVASDPELQSLSYSASGLPTGLSINPTTGLISGTVATGASAASPYSVSVTVSDGTNPVNVNFTWTVTAPAAGAQVTELVLMDVATGTPIMTLTNGAVITLSNYSSGINIVANTSGTITQVQFTANAAIVRTEGTAPYAIAGDSNGTYYTWSVAPGSYAITATPLNNPSGALTVNVTFN